MERDAIAACALDGMTLLYHRASGQTHMVISPVPEILDALDETRPASPADIHRHMSQRYELGDAAEAVALIGAHLAELAGLGLVRGL
ncbi:hypothetical protein L288_06630 [Sphingobium quisquiliarum P25]|uniref:HPr-rel-A system PqqD family protein n=1 Tax=Sphingobium quisquiliarum P25 TaxID=1329909 RepID=T0H849_9SPHN|nr:hypothetical protein L288_06630 [Sphingobium quisquiliarum P25]